MSKTSLPTVGQAYRSLRKNGEHLLEKHRNITSLDGLSFVHPTKGLTDIRVDNNSLAGCGRIYVCAGELSNALQKRGAAVSTLSDALRLACGYIYGKGMVWGFSGFATSGRDYNIEAQGMSRLFSYLDKIGQKPSLVVDGGASKGILGLSGVLSKKHKISSMGFVPLGGLASMAPRDYMVIHGRSYVDREALVGTVPNILVCVGGGDGTRRECQAALAHGNIVLLLMLKDYGPELFSGTYQDFEDIKNAQGKTLVVCSRKKDIPACIDTALAMNAQVNRPSRSYSFNALSKLFAV